MARQVAVAATNIKDVARGGWLEQAQKALNLVFFLGCEASSKSRRDRDDF